ncbi:MAG: DoxX family protein [Azospira oryzae]|jgi:putative oxidoreductase|nr:MAG: DoxX family protein [Azospira oryzae]
MKKYLFHYKPIATDIGLLLLRVGFALLLLPYGWEKFANYAAWSNDFPDPLHVGPAFSLALCIFAELICAALVGIGLFTRLALIPLLINMSVIFFVVHQQDPFKDKEHGLFFLIAYVVLMLTGPGRYSADAVIKK